MFRLLGFCVFFIFSLPALATSLFNPANGKLFVPYVTVGEQVFSAELQLAADSGVFQITDIRPRQTDTAPVYGQGAVFGADGRVSLPRIELDGEFFQGTLAYQDKGFVIDELLPLNDDAPERGQLLSATLVKEYSQIQLTQIFLLYSLQFGFSADIPVTNGIALYKVSYQTVDPAGALTPASALLVLPTGVDSPRPLAAVQHGTRVLDSEALTEALDDVPSLGLAASGYVVVAADYLGFGDSAGMHPFNHAASLAKTVVDALRAGKKAAQDHGAALTDQLFLAGYSEGGYATLALQRELETRHADEFTITASAPLAGAYDLSTTMVARMLEDSTYSNPYYFAYIALTLQRIYGVFDGLDEIFAAPYAADLSTYFDGQHDSAQINAFLPDAHRDMFSESAVAALGNPDSFLFAALRANDLWRWQPQAPTRLYHCVKDEQVPFANSQAAYDAFQALGATQVELFPVEDSRFDAGPEVHADCGVPIMLMVKTWFDGLL